MNSGHEKPSAVIDASFLYPICAQPEAVRLRLWNEITSRYQLVIPFVLVEEIWKDIVFPGEKEKEVINEAATAMFAMRRFWIDDPISFAFKELVLKQPVTKLTSPPQEIMESVWSLDDENPKLIAFLEDRRAAKEKRIKEIIAEQNSILSLGQFCFVDSKKVFFQAYIRAKFVETLKDSTRTKNLLQKVVGVDFRHRYPQDSEKIDSAFNDYNETTFMQYPITLHCIMAGMYYFYAPLFRIGKKGGQGARKLIGRSFRAQINNIEDEKYVISGLMCSRLITCDEGMANIMDAFKECGLWAGHVIYVHRANLPSEIPHKLV